MSKRSNVRHNNRPLYVPVQSSTVRDTRLSYRALGLLTYCLDQADSWNVRSEQLSRGEGREGRDAVRKALHELAANGYYRLERRRFLDGTTAMGAAVSHTPVKQWAQDYVTFGGKLDVPVIEQEDGTFRVKYPDNTLGPDGFADAEAETPEESAPEPDDAPQPKAAPKKRRTPPAAARKKEAPAETSEPEPEPEPEPEQAPEPEGEAPKKKTPAQEVATWYYDHAKEHLGPYAGPKKSGWYFGLLKLSNQAIDAGYTQKQVAKAFQRTGVHFPTAHQFQRALSDERNNKPMPSQYGGRPAPYSDAATWGTPGPGASDASTPDTPDDAVFGIDPV
ncbi:hypothetical protein [Streptomyces sp. BH055]|uniref:hypothetical protein n=1 Tax=Streptomyces sp. BH055 TaxID=3401173 RepID=UPI003BB5172B